MIRFDSDYLEGGHPAVLRRLTETNPLQTTGYGNDPYCREAANLIRSLCLAPEAQVHFFMGGTQVNRTMIAAALRPHQGVVAPETGHIAVHESGAIENSGHKVITLPSHDGKLDAAEVEALCQAHYGDESAEHMVQPGMVYISNPTEVGTVYSREELQALHDVCRRWHMPLYLDGARLGCALVAAKNDYTLADMASLVDAFTIGGTKMGALFGEALVLMNPALGEDLRYIIKQNGGMLAKGRLLGVQFLALLEDDLYGRIAQHEVDLALTLQKELARKSIPFMVGSPTNQQFPILSDGALSAIRDRFGFSLWQKLDGGMNVVRFCTSWATTPKQVAQLTEAIPYPY